MLGTLALATVMAAAFAQTPTNSSNGTMSTVDQGMQTGTTQTNNGTVVMFMRTNNMNWEDAAAATALARAMDVAPTQVMTMRGTMTGPYYQMAPAFIISHYSGKPVADIWQAYQGGQTWMQIANSYNLPTTYYNPGNVDTSNWTNDDFTNGVWHGVFTNYYGMTPDDWVYFSTRKMPMNELVVGEVLARQDNTPLKDVMTAYGTHPDWNSVDQQYAVNIGGPQNQSQNTQTMQTMQTTPAMQTTGQEAMSNGSNPTSSNVMAGTTNGSNMNGQNSGSSTVQPANNNAAVQGSTTTQTTTTTTAEPDNSPKTAANNGPVDMTAKDNPVQEWQINGGNIRPYDPWLGQGSSSTSSSYTLHRRARHHKARHHRHHVG
jgi:hypothetical protein